MTATTMTMAATTASSTSSFTMLTTSEILRHGKQAGNDSKKSAPPPEPAQPAKTTSTKQSSPTKDQKRASRDGAAQQDKSGKSKNYREAEKIVAQEKAQGEKMPKFEGLENYTLLEKMGDGAFSNVFKAMDNRAGRKVAVKVVRKYELNTTQVSSVPRPALHPR